MLLHNPSTPGPVVTPLPSESAEFGMMMQLYRCPAGCCSNTVEGAYRGGDCHSTLRSNPSWESAFGNNNIVYLCYILDEFCSSFMFKNNLWGGTS